MADDDNFDIDIYGEDLDDPSAPYKKVAVEDELFDDNEGKDASKNGGNAAATNGATEDTNMEGTTNTNESTKQESVPPQPPQNSLKRKHPDNRPVDANATTALYISDLHWWTTDDDIRGWVKQADCEDELKDITFSEHKVNGKSKGVAFVEFTTTQASSATKAMIESFAAQPGYQSKRHTVSYTSPNNNPFRTLPKDAPARNKDDNRGSGGFNKGGDRPHGPMGGNFPSPANFAPQSNMMGNNMGSGFRGNRGGGMMGNRGNMGGGGGYMNRGGHMGGGSSGSPPQQFGMMNPSGGFSNMGGGGGGMQFQGGGFGNNRGGMNMGMRGGGPPNRGRGGFNNNMGMPMGGMGPNMGMSPQMGGMNMPGPMGMGGNPGGDMGGNNSTFNPMMGGGFNPMMGSGGPPQFGNPNFNPQFFGQPQQGEQQWNPHGNKRQRQDP
ncbi:hypothetical protein ABW19_dt0203804 [Dactylella cylindrospora]|nr:hypothetical protein ABW19_dt0203804 [Dactylella cylindrospora]